jgi:hypothetical protein
MTKRAVDKERQSGAALQSKPTDPEVIGEQPVPSDASDESGDVVADGRVLDFISGSGRAARKVIHSPLRK